MGPTPTILIVEDDDGLRDILEERMASFGYAAVSADSAERALELVEHTPPDLVLSDVHMGTMTGIELVRRLRADPRFALTPVVLLTAVSDLDSRVAGLSAGADDFFAKPCELVELQARISSLLRIRRLHAELETRNRLLRTLFGRYVSEEIAAEIVRDPEKHLSPGGEKREVTVLFGDLRGFTTLAESLDAHDVVDILNAYLTEVIEIVFECGGTLDKFRGDGVMAVFGVPIAHDDDPLRAVRCALRLHERTRRLGFPRFPELRLQMGIGINTGIAVAGTIGSARRMDYTVIGGEVNLAQRFESSAGPGQTLITASTYDRVKHAVQVRELGALRVRGKADAVPAYDVLGPATTP
jgi:class 3 adenylate cyclase